MTNPIDQVEISVVCPIYNEAANVEPLLAELAKALEASGRTFETLCVDDASDDDSVARLKAAQTDRPWLRVIRHTKRSGQSAAILSGYREALGSIVVSMDADLQYDCGDILRLADALEQRGVDAVAGIRAKRQDSTAKKISSKLANAYRRWVTSDDTTDAGCAFRAIRREALRELIPFNGLHRFLPLVLKAQGFRVAEIEVAHRQRTRGVSKYGIHNRLWRGLADCMAMRWYKKRAFPAMRISKNHGEH
ncbi:glycosyltransferase [Candidatus Sumerlaeota bacterium]|nr:glycosyltransferase [Candidatus Sumerlaeota bacterium]